MPKRIAKKFNYSGRGRSSSTFIRHLDNMYRLGISFEPKLVLKPFDSVKTYAYFCRKRESKGITALFEKLKKDNRITYIIVLSGSDFFITSRDSSLDLSIYDLETAEKSIFYTPLFTIPKGWNYSMSKTLGDFANAESFKKGTLSRTVYTDLSWTDLDWKIFHLMKSNVRKKISTITSQIGSNYNTTKSHFLGHVLPSCTVAHYFFPKGYNFYQQLMLKFKTDYEIDFVKALEKLPCTSYVYLLEGELFVVIFHEQIAETLDAIKKLEEAAIIDDYFLFNPLMHDYP